MTPSSAEEGLSSRTRTGSWRIAAAVSVLLLAGTAVAVAPALLWGAPDTAEAGVAPAVVPARCVLEQDGLRYEYDALLDRESLYLLAAPDDDVAESRPADVERLRRALLRQLRVESLASIRHAHQDVADALRRLGYL